MCGSSFFSLNCFGVKSRKTVEVDVHRSDLIRSVHRALRQGLGGDQARSDGRAARAGEGSYPQPLQGRHHDCVANTRPRAWSEGGGTLRQPGVSCSAPRGAQGPRVRSSLRKSVPGPQNPAQTPPSLPNSKGRKKVVKSPLQRPRDVSWDFSDCCTN